MPTNVTLLLKGSLVLFAKESQTVGTVRILKDPPPNHVLKLNFNVQPPGGTIGPDIPVSPIQNALRIDVQNTAHPTITLRGKHVTIDRSEGPTEENEASYKWFVDLENHELYDDPIGTRKYAFKQILTFNSGELFSRDHSYNRLLFQHGVNSNYEEFGFVAVEIGVEFSGAERVVFTNGGGLVFDSAEKPAGTNYRIKLDHDLEDASDHPEIVTDANHYYKGVGSGIPPEERKLFASVREDLFLKAVLTQGELRGHKPRFAERDVNFDPPAGPEAACFPAYLSRSNP